jgi:hypothetical protein
MVPYAREQTIDDCAYLPIRLPWSKIAGGLAGKARFMGTLDAITSRNQKTELFSPSGALVYFPYYICESESGGALRRFVLDPLSGRVLHDDRGESRLDNLPTGDDLIAQCGAITVELHRCPNCGVDLPATPSSVYICANCRWVVSLDKNHRLAGGIISSDDCRPDDTLFPFWLFDIGRDHAAQLAGPAAASITDQVAVPGFRIANFDVARKLSQRMSAVLGTFPSRPLDDDCRTFPPVTVAMTDALAMVDIAIYCRLLANNPRLAGPPSQIIPRKVGLLFAPFHPEEYFYVDSLIGAVTFERGAYNNPAATPS